MSKLNPGQTFVVVALTRESIAEDIRMTVLAHREQELVEDDDISILPPDDPKLTDDLCTKYRDEVQDALWESLDRGGADRYFDWVAEIDYKFAVALGLIEQSEAAALLEPPPEPELGSH